MTDLLRVLLVDDSRIFRGAIQSALETLPWVRIVGSVFSGEKALAHLDSIPTDLVLLDLDMPGLPGIDTLKRIQRTNAHRAPAEPVGVLVLTDQADDRTELVRQAKALGAFDCFSKPAYGPSETIPVQALLNSLQPLLERYRNRLNRSRLANPGSRILQRPVDPSTPPAGLPALPPQSSGIRPALNPRHFAAVAIGVSTGGPKALTSLIPTLVPQLDVPILIVQHMPAGFTASLAESLAKLVPDWSCAEARQGEEIQGRMIRVAPGGKHLEVRRNGAKTLIELTDTPPECGCKPAADVLFRSMATAYGPRVAAFVLTGMGSDGTKGALEIRKSGGLVLAQDESTSVVWGMPGSALNAGAVHDVAPLDRLPQLLTEWIRRRTSP